jgi:hypothetical protein
VRLSGRRRTGMTEKPRFINWDLIIEQMMRKNKSTFKSKPLSKEEKEARMVIGDRQKELQEQLDAINDNYYKQGYESF